jgi:hypothetical protein
MFGKHWTAASGLVVDKRTIRTTGDGMVSVYEFVVDVSTPGGEVFRAKVGDPKIATNFKDPSVGMTVRVEYDEKSRDVRFDKDDPQLSWKTYKQDRKSGFEETLHQAPGTPMSSASAVAATGGFDIAALLKAQGITGDETQVFAPQVVQMDPGSPEAAALREALLRAMGGAPAPEVEQPPA